VNLEQYLQQKHPPKPTTLDKMREALLSDARPATGEELAEIVIKTPGYIRELLAKNSELNTLMRQNYQAKRIAEMHRIYAVYLSKPRGVDMHRWAKKNGTSTPMLYRAKEYVEELTGQSS